MEVNAPFANGNTIKPAARAFADFLLRELRAAEDGSRHGIAVTARRSTQLLIHTFTRPSPKPKPSKTRTPNRPPSRWRFSTRFGAVSGSEAKYPMTRKRARAQDGTIRYAANDSQG